jgi:Protein of unknown function (DUF4054)
MAWDNPTITDFKTQFSRDFPYGTDPSIAVTDNDIGYAFRMTNVNINQGNWATQDSYSIGYNLLSAHYMVLNLRASSQGINGQYNWLQNNKSVQGVAEGFSIPDRILTNPLWSQFTKTNYGAQYLQLLLPQLAGKIYTVCGTTRA